MKIRRTRLRQKPRPRLRNLNASHANPVRVDVEGIETVAANVVNAGANVGVNDVVDAMRTDPSVSSRDRKLPSKLKFRRKNPFWSTHPKRPLKGPPPKVRTASAGVVGVAVVVAGAEAARAGIGPKMPRADQNRLRILPNRMKPSTIAVVNSRPN